MYFIPADCIILNFCPGPEPIHWISIRCTLKYKAAFTDYVQFDTNDPYSTPFKYVMGSFDGMTMKGVDEGLRYMKGGGT